MWFATQNKFHKDWCLLWRYAVWPLQESTFRRNLAPPSSAYVGGYLQPALFLVHRFLSPWRRRRYVPPKRRFLRESHGVTSQKTPFFIVTAVKTSNLTSFIKIGSDVEVTGCFNPAALRWCNTGSLMADTWYDLWVCLIWRYILRTSQTNVSHLLPRKLQQIMCT
jgi:hypothetical protein